MFIIAFIYCIMVYLAGETGDANAGYKYLVGIPNYYLFYLAIFPYVTAGITFIATHNINIRFFGKLNNEISEEKKSKITFYRKLLLFITIVFSLAVSINDASDKGRTLPPYSLSLASEQIYLEATNKYFELKSLESERRKKSPNIDNSANNTDLEAEYFSFIKQKGYKGNSSTGFQSFSSWYHNSSIIYKVESFLSWIAAFVISIFFAQFFLIIIIKEYVLAETKNLVLWLLILCSLWIPCKIFSAYYYTLKPYNPPAIVWFAIILLAISIVLAIFIKIDKNDMSKYATIIVSVFSFLITSISIFRPEYFELALEIIQQLGWMYGGIILFLMAFSIHLVTDHLIDTYEQSKNTISDPIINNIDSNEPQ